MVIIINQHTVKICCAVYTQEQVNRLRTIFLTIFKNLYLKKNKQHIFFYYLFFFINSAFGSFHAAESIQSWNAFSLLSNCASGHLEKHRDRPGDWPGLGPGGLGQRVTVMSSTARVDWRQMLRMWMHPNVLAHYYSKMWEQFNQKAMNFSMCGLIKYYLMK